MDAESMPTSSYSITIRVELDNVPGTLARLTGAIGYAGGNIGAIDLVSAGPEKLTRDVTIYVRNTGHGQDVVDAIRHVQGVRLVSWSDKVFLLHLGGKIRVASKVPLRTREALSMAYTPGVARVCEAIAEDPSKSFNLTIRRNTVAIVTDGTAVLGLGDIGPEAALPVMEGKAMLFKEFANVDAFPICLATKDANEIVSICRAIAPTFGGINLEDISSPRCFEIEERLKDELDIPVFHDDQHGTAVVVTAALINALKVVGKSMDGIKVVQMGAGASGVACAKMMMSAGVKNIVGVDRQGTIYRGRKEHMNEAKEWFAAATNPERVKGDIAKAAEGADVFLGLSGPNLFPVEALKKMAKDPIVFALANPVPEIMPEEAAPYAAVIATGRSDYPNQINNVLCFPGLFRGALDVRATTVNEQMKLAAARAIAGCISEKELSAEYIIPSVFDKRVVDRVAKSVSRAAVESGVARRKKRQFVTE
jgi:malate dehydrogenase (oxaloacetate-decarboxylating)